ncbi:MAG: RNA polymerase sigma-54 factor, partial [Deltaproteobacteria bacterium]|nr:RNA polymerase sigma-54 factor [Deltaproteobacteria bacterium]
MALEIKQSLSMVQQLVMTPQLQQAIKLLQLSHQELVEEIQTQMVENPALEIDSEAETSRLADGNGELAGKSAQERAAEVPASVASAQDVDEVGPGRDPISEMDWAKYMESLRDQAPDPERRARIEELPSLDANLTRQGTLADHLEWQLRLTQLSEAETRIGLAIIYNLDEHGYLLGTTVDELARDLEVDAASVEVIRKRIQHFDPLGVASISLADCLAVQAAVVFPGDEGMLEVIEHHLHNLEKKNYAQIARDLKIPLEEVYQIHRQVTELDPRPGRAFYGEDPRYITPDISIIKVGDHHEAVLNEDGLPKLKISDYYRRALSGDRNRQTRDYI